jgi:hypothetical protein
VARTVSVWQRAQTLLDELRRQGFEIKLAFKSGVATLLVSPGRHLTTEQARAIRRNRPALRRVLLAERWNETRAERRRMCLG